jgi:hypothetical protein
VYLLPTVSSLELPPLPPGIAYQTVRILEKRRHVEEYVGAQDSTNPKVLWLPQELRYLRCPSARDASDLEDRWDATCTDRRIGGARRRLGVRPRWVRCRQGLRLPGVTERLLRVQEVVNGLHLDVVAV